MSELPRTPLQANIDRDGGLYDQARAEDTLRFTEHKNDQDAAYATYAYNIQTTQRREQDEAYATYEDNIQVTRDREAAELKRMQKKLRNEKIKRGFGRAAAIALLIPGVDYIAETVQEEFTSAKLNQKRRTQYKEHNGTLFGNKSKGYSSTLGTKYNKYASRFNGKNEAIIQDLETLIAEHEQRTRQE